MTKLFEDPPPEIAHTAHPAHKLKLVTSDDAHAAPFKCDGCNEPGNGPRYTCDDCGSSHSRRFDLHTRCALAESRKDTIEHPLFRNRVFKFRQQPPPPVNGTICDACGEPAHGFVYHCSEKNKGGGGLDLHPCCATLPERICKDGHALVLRPSTSRRCCICGHRDDGRYWAYRFEGEDGVDDMHVACLKKTAYQIWETAYENQYHSGGAQNLHVGLTDIDGLLQICKNSQTSGGLDQFIRIAGSVASIIIAIIFANPAALISAIPKKY
ncbi:hypothetical protein BDA96_07G132000 [Sorghum bicolor]|jgi:hypothetical protein|uniref:DC1 domain-containing protein n=2 Tax=Sorghum bicolor TaxID=4558 RepID=C5YKS9_SORBI|nr:uncharacterized protein LOC8070063 [Sorghum bicolor]EES14967.1 hypothetical protein SORBI_3007G123300 [Sorghum bicolor]KAG0523547.1 hypothetical protein BDA96_07G132000 [Sorghum bicolor]|eukprot:XP_002445472.1 uncharacterized protein LOC8070063 [Sorghum bicolor]